MLTMKWFKIKTVQNILCGTLVPDLVTRIPVSAHALIGLRMIAAVSLKPQEERGDQIYTTAMLWAETKYETQIE